MSQAVSTIRALEVADKICARFCRARQCWHLKEELRSVAYEACVSAGSSEATAKAFGYYARAVMNALNNYAQRRNIVTSSSRTQQRRRKASEEVAVKTCSLCAVPHVSDSLYKISHGIFACPAAYEDYVRRDSRNVTPPEGYLPLEESDSIYSCDAANNVIGDEVLAAIYEHCEDESDKKIVALRLVGLIDKDIANKLGMSRPSVQLRRSQIEARYNESCLALGA